MKLVLRKDLPALEIEKDATPDDLATWHYSMAGHAYGVDAVRKLEDLARDPRVPQEVRREIALHLHIATRIAKQARDAALAHLKGEAPVRH